MREISHKKAQKTQKSQITFCVFCAFLWLQITPQLPKLVKIKDDLYLSKLLFPRIEKHMDKFAILRSMLSHEEVHFRAQYYQQTGRQLNLAFAREIPAIGSVVAMELESRRRREDTFPTYMSFFLEKGAAGALSTGFLPPRFSVVDINPEAAVKGNALDQKAIAKYLHENQHKTIVGPIAFSADGEWKETAALQAQFRGVVDKDTEQFRQSGKQTILYPERLKSGDLVTPFEAARK